MKGLNMSNILAQNATQLAVSNSQSDWDESRFADAVYRAMQRKVGKSGITTERLMMKRNELISAVCSDYRAHFAAIYGKSDRLPSDVHAKIVEQVDKATASQLTRINPTNCINLREYYYADFKQLEITQRVTATGENKVLLQHQLTACNSFVSQIERRIRDLESQNMTPKNLDMLKEAKARLNKFNMLHEFIKGELAHQAKLTEEVKEQ